MARPIITLTTDFGESSSYVGQMKGVILSRNPNANLVDISHAIPSQDVQHAALVMGDTWHRFPAGTIHIVVVDPGVGTDRHVVLVQCGGHYFIAPDNGVLTSVVEAVSPSRTIVLDKRDYWLADVSATFHGRDIMSPVAAHLSLGIDAVDMGSELDDLVRLSWTSPDVTDEHIAGEVVTIDSFGNLITNIDRSCLMHVPDDRTPKITYRRLELDGIIQTYAEGSPGRLAALLGSSGRLELALPNGNAARRHDGKVGDRVLLSW